METITLTYDGIEVTLRGTKKRFEFDETSNPYFLIKEIHDYIHDFAGGVGFADDFILKESVTNSTNSFYNWDAMANFIKRLHEVYCARNTRRVFKRKIVSQLDKLSEEQIDKVYLFMSSMRVDENV